MQRDFSRTEEYTISEPPDWIAPTRQKINWSEKKKSVASRSANRSLIVSLTISHLTRNKKITSVRAPPFDVRGDMTDPLSHRARHYDDPRGGGVIHHEHG